MATKRVMKVYKLVWSPTGQTIATNVRASTMKAAKRKAPAPYRKYLGEIYAEEQGVVNPRRRTVARRRVANSKKTFAAKAIIMPNGKVKVFVSPGVMAKIKRVNNPENFTVRKSGGNYVILFRGKRAEGPPHATRATALKYAQIMENEWRRRQSQ